jgi:hypothetical protein
MREITHHQPDDEGSKNLWNVGKLLPDYTMQHPRRQSTSQSPPWEPEISPDCCSLLWWLSFSSQATSHRFKAQPVEINDNIHGCDTRYWKFNPRAFQIRNNDGDLQSSFRVWNLKWDWNYDHVDASHWDHHASVSLHCTITESGFVVAQMKLR